MSQSTVVFICIAPEEGAPTVEKDEVKAVAGKGLEGDRYYKLAGTFSRKRDPGNEVTLIEWEALDSLQRDHGIDLGLGGSRRNLVTKEIALDGLVGREFVVGGATLEGVRLNPPCGYLERLTQPGVKKGLEGRGGINARILSGGPIRKGDGITLK